MPCLGTPVFMSFVMIAQFVRLVNDVVLWQILPCRICLSGWKFLPEEKW